MEVSHSVGGKAVSKVFNWHHEFLWTDLSYVSQVSRVPERVLVIVLACPVFSLFVVFWLFEWVLKLDQSNRSLALEVWFELMVALDDIALTLDQTTVLHKAGSCDNELLFKVDWESAPELIYCLFVSNDVTCWCSSQKSGCFLLSTTGDHLIIRMDLAIGFL